MARPHYLAFYKPHTHTFWLKGIIYLANTSLTITSLAAGGHQAYKQISNTQKEHTHHP